MPPETCPNCGADVPPHAKACPECGSDEKTGWAEDAYAGGLGLPDEEFNYDEFVQRELEPHKTAKPRGLHWIWWLVGILLVLGFFLGWIL